MGKPGAYGDPQAMAAVTRIAHAAIACGKYAGVGGDSDLGRQESFIREGVRFISMPSDAALLAAGAKRAADDLRRIAGEELKN